MLAIKSTSGEWVAAVLSRLQHDRKYQIALLAAITLLAAGLRLYKLDEWSLWIDEAWSIRDSLALGNTQPVFSKLHFLYYLLLKPFLLFLGISEWTARLPAALVGVLTVPLLFAPIKRFLGTNVALLTSILIAVAPWHLYWSQNARFYTLLLLLYNLSLLCFYWGLESGRSRYTNLSIVLLGFAIVTHPTAVLLALIFILYLLLLKIGPIEEPPGLYIKSFLPFVLLPFLYLFYELIRFWGGQRLISSVIFSTFFVGGESFLHGIRLLIGVVYYIGVPLIITALVGGIWLLVEKRREGLLFLLGALVPLLLMFAPVSQTRYAFISLPSWIILAALLLNRTFGWTKSPQHYLSLAVLFLLLGTPISEVLLYYNYQNGQRWDWKGAYAVVAEDKAAEDLVVTTWAELGEYYLQERVELMHKTTPDYVQNSGKRVWFVDDGWSNPELYMWLQEFAVLHSVHDVHIPGKVYEVRVFRYEP